MLQGVANKPVLTRALDYNSPSDINNTGAIPVVNGTVNATTTWVLTSTVNTVGTDPLTFTEFSLKPSTIVTTSRTLTIGGTAQDLSADRTWLTNVTNDVQTKSAIVPNTTPSAGQILAGNAGGTAYAPVSLSGSGATATLSSAGVLTLSAIANSTLSNSAITIAGTSTALGGTITVDTITGVSSNGFVKRTGANTYTNIADPLPVANGGTGATTNNGGWNIVQLTADATTTSTTSVDVVGASGPTLVTPTLASSTLYEFEATLYAVNAADTTGMKFGCRTVSGTGAAFSCLVAGVTSNSGAAISMVPGGVGGSNIAGTAFDIVSGQVAVIKIWGFYLTGSTGTPVVAITFAKVTSNTATVKSGSVIKWRVMGQ